MVIGNRPEILLGTVKVRVRYKIQSVTHVSSKCTLNRQTVNLVSVFLCYINTNLCIYAEIITVCRYASLYVDCTCTSIRLKNTII